MSKERRMWYWFEDEYGPHSIDVLWAFGDVLEKLGFINIEKVG